MIVGADLGEERPVGVPEQIDEEHACGGDGLADGFGLPMLLEFDEQEVVAQLGFGEAWPDRSADVRESGAVDGNRRGGCDWHRNAAPGNRRSGPWNRKGWRVIDGIEHTRDRWCEWLDRPKARRWRPPPEGRRRGR